MAKIVSHYSLSYISRSQSKIILLLIDGDEIIITLHSGISSHRLWASHSSDRTTILSLFCPMTTPTYLSSSDTAMSYYNNCYCRCLVELLLACSYFSPCFLRVANIS